MLDGRGMGERWEMFLISEVVVIVVIVCEAKNLFCLISIDALIVRKYILIELCART